MNRPLEYVRTDRNGTKIYHDWNCPRCGGEGQSTMWSFTGFTCWECGGSGKRVKPLIVKEYTPEYAEKLEARRIAKREAELAKNPPPSDEELKAKARDALGRRFESVGLSRDGIGYVYEGKTYPVKDAIKASGGRWGYGVWIAPIKIDVPNNVTVREIDANPFVDEYGSVNLIDAIFPKDPEEVERKRQKAEKIAEIKKMRDDGMISDEDAVEMIISLN